MNDQTWWKGLAGTTIASARRHIGGRTSRQITTVLSGHALRLALGLVSSALLARALGPENLSTFSVVSAGLMIAVTLADFGLSNSAVRLVASSMDQEPAAAQRTAGVFAWSKLLGSLAITLTVLLAAGPIATLLQLPAGSGPSLVRIGALGVLATSLSGIVSPVLQSLRRFGPLVLSQTANVGLTVLLMAVLFLVSQLTVTTALWVGVLSALGGAILGWLTIPAGWRRAIIARPADLGAGARRLWRFGRWLWLSVILAIVYVQLDLLLLNLWATAEETGIYALALNLALKAEIVNQTVQLVLLPEASRVSGEAERRAYLRSGLLRSLALVVLLLVMLPLARPFILLVYGPEYAPSVGIFSLLLASTAVELLALPFVLLVYPLNMPRHVAAGQAIRVATILLAGWLLIPAWGVVGAALAKLAATLAGVLFLVVLVWRRLSQSATLAHEE
jgi:O-antigen/teichoic acid export membrane protein